MKYLFCACMLFVVLAGCESSKMPKDIIPPAQMSAILYDMHLTDGYLSSIPGQDSARKVGAAWYTGVYKKHKVDSARYSKSLDFYYKDPELLKGVYDQVSERLKKAKEVEDKLEEKRLKAMRLLEKKKKTKDSLDNLQKKVKPLKKDSAKITAKK